MCSYYNMITVCSKAHYLVSNAIGSIGSKSSYPVYMLDEQVTTEYIYFIISNVKRRE